MGRDPMPLQPCVDEGGHRFVETSTGRVDTAGLPLTFCERCGRFRTALLEL